LLDLAEALGSPVASTPRAKGVMPETHPLALGPFGLAGSSLADHVIGDEADVLLCVGTRLGEISTAGWTSRLARPRMIRADINPTAINLNYPAVLGLIGDARATLEAIRNQVRLTQAKRRPLPTRGPSRLAVSSPDAEERAPWLLEPPASSGTVLSPDEAMHAVGRALAELPEDEIFVDIGTVMLYATRLLVVERPRVHVNWTFGTMGHATPAAVGAAHATGRRTWALVGDAAFAQTGLEVHTACERDLPVVVVAFNNGGNVMCEAGARMMGADAPPAMFRRRLNIAAISRLLGARARVVRTLPELRRALVWASLTRKRPVVLDVRIDPLATPPMGARLRVLSFTRGSSARAGGGSK
jgi:acetolactate synthase-1/2/3 large subunit